MTEQYVLDLIRSVLLRLQRPPRVGDWFCSDIGEPPRIRRFNGDRWQEFTDDWKPVEKPAEAKERISPHC